MADTGLSIFDAGPPPACPARFNMAAHTLFHANAPDTKVALQILAAPGQVAESWTYGDLRRAVLATAGGFRAHGIYPGDRVVLRLGHEVNFPILVFGLLAIGAVPVPTSPMLTAREFAAIVGDVAPSALCFGTGLAMPTESGAAIFDADAIAGLQDHAPAAIANTRAEDTALIVYTSGTGGRPKGVEHAHRAAWARRMMWRSWYGLTARDRVLHAGAFNWTFTLGAGLTDPWAVGATALIFTGGKDRAVWAALAKAHDASIFAAAPGVYRQLLASEADCRSGFAGLRHGITAGEKLPAALHDQWVRATGKPLFEAYGMSEISTFVSSGPTTPVRPGAIGKPQTGRRVAILPESSGAAPVPIGTAGALAVSRRDPGLMKGYWRQPETTAGQFRGEWFVTGDRARMDADGYVCHLGRIDEVMNAQGYRVSPQEIEEVILASGMVADCAVCELEVREGVFIIAAFVVAPAAPDHNALRTHCAEFLADYKCPRSFDTVADLPRSANGKLLRRELVRRYGWKGTS